VSRGARNLSWNTLSGQFWHWVFVFSRMPWVSTEIVRLWRAAVAALSHSQKGSLTLPPMVAVVTVSVPLKARLLAQRTRSPS